MGEAGPEIRIVTVDSLESDLRALQSGDLELGPDVAAKLPDEIRTRNVAFWLATTIDTSQIIGRVGITWCAPRTISLRRMFEGNGIISNGNDIPNLGLLKVLGPYRGLGVGGRLLRTVHDEAHRRSADRLYLTVNTDNLHAQSIYGHLGYEATGLKVYTKSSIRAPNGTYSSMVYEQEVFLKKL